MRRLDERPARPGISVCMPAYNEAENLAATIEQALTVMAARFVRVEIIVVDDGSLDGTRELLTQLAGRHAGLRVVHHPTNMGYGAAARSALAAATEDLILFTDADRQFAFEDIARLLDHIDEHDLVIGYRASRRDPWNRVLMGRAWTMLTNRLFGYLARDVNCAFKLVWRRAFVQVAPRLQSNGATFSAEWLAWSRRAQLRMTEVPVRHFPRRAGLQTGARTAVITTAARELLALRARVRAARANG